jgi:hypothetical protein
VPTSVGVQEVFVYPPLCVWIPSVFTLREETGGFGLLLQFFPETLWMIETMGYGKRNHNCPASVLKILFDASRHLVQSIVQHLCVASRRGNHVCFDFKSEENGHPILGNR